MADNSNKNNGQNIGDIVRSALHTGDLTKLRHLGPAVESTVRDIQHTVENAVKGTAGGGQQGARQPYRPPQPPTTPARPAWQGASTPAAKMRAMPGGTAGVAQVALGVLGVVAFGLCTLAFAALGATMASVGHFWPLSAFFAVATGVSGVALAGGLATRGLVKRVRQYYALLESKKVYTFDELAARLGLEPKEIKRDIRRARKKRMLADVRTDADETCIMKGEDTYRLYLESQQARRQREEEEAERARLLQDPATADMERFRSEGQATIRKISEANEAMPGEVISGKLDRLEASCARIFDYVAGHPEKLADCRKFMNYYLPTTLKLVEKYRQYEEMELQPANILKAKQEIENSLDTIVTAFDNLFANLYHEDTLDVSTDIQVLETMLEQEGLTGKRFNIEEDGR